MASWLLRMVAMLLVGIVLTGELKAQQGGEPGPDTSKLIREFSIIPLPAIAYNPTFGLMLGVAPGFSWYMGNPESTSISSALGTLIYTTKKQFLFTFKSNVFYKDDSWNFLGDWRYFITSQPTYGLGSGPQTVKPVGAGDIEYEDGQFNKPIPDAQMLEFNYLRFHETAMKRIADTRYFLGLGYHLDIHSKIKDNLLNVEEDSLTSHYSYQVLNGLPLDAYTLSGISLNALLDSRDNAVNPYSGRYAYVNLRINPTFLGSTANSGLLWLEYRDYLHLSKERPRHLIGFWTYGWFKAWGKVPFMDLPAVGWDQFGRSGRAYTQGRIRGENLVYGEIEYRFPLQKNKETFGGAIFVNTTTASNGLEGEHAIGLFDYMDFAGGIGLRVMVNKESRANLCLDYAWGMHGASGFYFGINEVF